MSVRRPPDGTDVHRILRLTEMPVALYAVGDIHGCLALYDDLERQIIEDGRNFSGPKLILCLGDVIDRGPSTCSLLDRLAGPAPDDFEIVVLRGNHEDMMVKFLDSPARNMSWVEFGGAETLSSYGLRPHSAGGFKADSGLLEHKLQLGIPDAHRLFLKNLPLALEVADFRFAHAGYSLGKSAREQSPEQLLWGPPERADDHIGPEILVHGHVAVDNVAIAANRINLDIGAHRTGRLAAMRFLRTSDERKIFVTDKKSASVSPAHP